MRSKNRGTRRCSKALRGPGSTVTWVPSVASTPSSKAGSPKCWQREWGLERACYPGLGSGVSSPSGVPQPPRVLMLAVFSDDLSCCWNPCVYCASVAPLGTPRSSGAPVLWTTWTPGFYTTGGTARQLATADTCYCWRKWTKVLPWRAAKRSAIKIYFNFLPEFNCDTTYIHYFQLNRNLQFKCGIFNQMIASMTSTCLPSDSTDLTGALYTHFICSCILNY